MDVGFFLDSPSLKKTAIGEGNIADQSPYQVQGGKAKLCQVKLKYWDDEEKQNLRASRVGKNKSVEIEINRQFA
jgi:hypothetical protein